MAISDEIKQQTVKFKNMNRQQKIDYIWTYYKWWIIGAIIVIVSVISVINTVKDNSKPEYLGAIFLNSKNSSNSAQCTLEKEFLAAYGMEEKDYKSGFDYVTYLDDNYGNQASLAGQVKLVSLYSAGQLDIVTGNESVMSGPGDPGGYAKLEEILPEGMLDDLKDKGYEFYYYTEKVYEEGSVPDENGYRPYTDGETYLAGIYLDNCAKLVGNASTCVYDEGMEDRPVLTITWNGTNIDHAIEFIKFVTE